MPICLIPPGLTPAEYYEVDEKIDERWQEVALELAVVVNRQRIHRMHNDMLLGWELAKEVLRLKGVE